MSSGIITSCDKKIYAFSSFKTTPEFLEEVDFNRKALRKNQEYKQRCEVVQNFNFRDSCAKLRLSRDGRSVGCCGVYPPSFKLFDLDELSLKFERQVDAAIVDFVFLTDDYQKFAAIEADRHIEIHAKGGRYFKTRIPHEGRSIAYNPWNADLLVTSSSFSIYRLNLFDGCFKPSFESTSEETTAALFNPLDKCVYVGNCDGFVEMFDDRVSTAPARVQRVAAADAVDAADGSARVSAAAIAPEGLYLAFGTGEGLVHVYDARNMQQPLYSYDHNIDAEIRDVLFAETLLDRSSERTLLSADVKNLCAWKPLFNRAPEEVFSFSAEARINSIAQYKNSGFVFVAAETPKFGLYYIPDFGPSPKWIPYAEKLVEEMERKAEETLFEGYEFLTLEQFRALAVQFADYPGKIRPHQHGVLIEKKTLDAIRASFSAVTSKALKKKLIDQMLERAEQSDPLSTVINVSKAKKHHGEFEESATRQAIQRAAKTKNKFKAADHKKASEDVLKDPRFTSLVHSD